MKKYMVYLFFILIITGCAHQAFDEAGWEKRVSATEVKKLYAPHFKDGEFFNPWMPVEEKSFFDLLEWQTSRAEEYTTEEESYKPENLKDTLDKISKLDKSKNYILWIGHNSFFLKIGDTFWITDPMFSPRALLPKRLTSPGITIKDLKKIIGDKSLNIIITHNHYDHMDSDSIEELPENSRVFAPLGLKESILELNKSEVIEMDWWQKHKIDEKTEMIFLPTQHWSRRIGQSFNTTLWGSYLLKIGKYKIYFGGDSGYFIGYKEFGKKFKDIDYAFIPVTAYHPRWFMYYNHMNAPEAIRAFEELKAKYFIPTQWGTFRLGDEPIGLPALDMKRVIKKRNLKEKQFLIMDLGEVLIMK